MKITYDTVDGVDVEKQLYEVCSRCFNGSIVQSAELLVLPDLMMDRVENVIIYIARNDYVQCDAKDPDAPMEQYC